MAPYPSCDILNPSSRAAFLSDKLELFDLFQERHGAYLEDFEDMRQRHSLYDCLRLSIDWNPRSRAGVYALWFRDEIVYVGKSQSSVASRIESHRRDKLFDSVSAIYAVPPNQGFDEERARTDPEGIDWLEEELIFLLVPVYNKQGPILGFYKEICRNWSGGNKRFLLNACCLDGKIYVSPPGFK
jgi:hypothetical protein